MSFLSITAGCNNDFAAEQAAAADETCRSLASYPWTQKHETQIFAASCMYKLYVAIQGSMYQERHRCSGIIGSAGKTRKASEVPCCKLAILI
jgi:hypothetical protein